VSPEIVYLGTQSASATVKVHVADLPARGKTFPILGLFAPMLGLAILGMSGVRRRALLACLSGIAVLAIVACGGDASRPKSMQQRIEVQRKYGVTITADSGKRRHTIIKTVYLQQASAD
jgi:hypothetical protein